MGSSGHGPVLLVFSWDLLRGGCVRARSRQREGGPKGSPAGLGLARHPGRRKPGLIER